MTLEVYRMDNYKGEDWICVSEYGYDIASLSVSAVREILPLLIELAGQADATALVKTGASYDG